MLLVKKKTNSFDSNKKKKPVLMDDDVTSISDGRPRGKQKAFGMSHTLIGRSVLLNFVFVRWDSKIFVFY